MALRNLATSQEERFWGRVARCDVGCWNWISPSTDGSYGVVRFNERQQKAHRVSYSLLVGPIPEGKVLDHLCGNKLCVRPDHLEPVTQAENIRRARLKSEWRRCSRGHEFNEENTRYNTENGRLRRTCRACIRENYHAKKREAA